MKETTIERISNFLIIYDNFYEFIEVLVNLQYIFLFVFERKFYNEAVRFWVERILGLRHLTETSHFPTIARRKVGERKRNFGIDEILSKKENKRRK